LCLAPEPIRIGEYELGCIRKLGAPIKADAISRGPERQNFKLLDTDLILLKAVTWEETEN
jgi:hypothetical protein